MHPTGTRRHFRSAARVLLLHPGPGGYVRSVSRGHAVLGRTLYILARPAPAPGPTRHRDGRRVRIAPDLRGSAAPDLVVDGRLRRVDDARLVAVVRAHAARRHPAVADGLVAADHVAACYGDLDDVWRFEPSGPRAASDEGGDTVSRARMNGIESEEPAGMHEVIQVEAGRGDRGFGTETL